MRLGFLEFVYYVITATACFGIAYCVAILGYHNWNAFLGTLIGVLEIAVFGFCGSVSLIRGFASLSGKMIV